jgi:hypothetical protein
MIFRFKKIEELNYSRMVAVAKNIKLGIGREALMDWNPLAYSCLAIEIAEINKSESGKF